jgi:hypothetical protein
VKPGLKPFTTYGKGIGQWKREVLTPDFERFGGRAYPIVNRKVNSC